MVLDKKDTLFERDEEGKLVPQTVELIVDEDDERQSSLAGEEIIVTPLLRGEIKRLTSEVREAIKDADDEEETEEIESLNLDERIVLEHCIKPEYSEEEVRHMKDWYLSPIVNTILNLSGLDVSKAKNRDDRKKAALKAEDDFAKN